MGFPARPPADRFWERVDTSGDCWRWLGAHAREGYGVFGAERVNGRNRFTNSHRFAYELLVGPVAPGLHLDHLCRNRWCCNPAHLEPVSPRTNTLRGIGPSAENALKTHCKHGHEFTPDNTYIAPSTGNRACLTCRRAIAAAWNARVARDKAELELARTGPT